MRNIQILGTLICCLCGLMFFPNQVYSQLQSSNRALEVIVDESSNAYFSINFEKGQTLYSICKEFHIATIDAMMLNEIVNPDQISVGETLILPLNREFFKVNKPSGQNYIPVYYKVKKQETLFRISKVYFAQDVKHMIERNELSGFTLSIDEQLLVGYYQVNSSYTAEVSLPVSVEPKSSMRPAVSAPAPTNNLEDQAGSNEYVLVDSHVVKEQNTDHASESEKVAKAEENFKPEPILDNSESPVTEVVEAEQSIEKKSKVHSLPVVGTYRFKPTSKAQFKKVIGSEKLDHSVSNNKYEQMKAESIADSEISDAETISDSTHNQFIEEKAPTNLISKSTKGIAHWDKKGKDYENLMVLHKTAEVNTLIKLTNPVNGMSTFARVVGKIPENAFKKDIDVVLSPAVARKIGAIDARMQIAMTYQIIKP